MGESAGRWDQLKPRLQERWRLLTEYDLERIGRDEERLPRLLQERYGYEPDRAEKECASFLSSLS